MKKITLNELRKIIRNNLLTEALNFEAMVAQQPPYFQKFNEKFNSNINSFRFQVRRAFDKSHEKFTKWSYKGDPVWEEWHQKENYYYSPEFIKLLHEAWTKYFLICYMEKNMPYTPISAITLDEIVDNANIHNFTMDQALTLDLQDPTHGMKGKFTEFITKILASNFYIPYNPAEGIINLNETNLLLALEPLKEFVEICDKSASNMYKSKMEFFDTQIMPYLAEKQVAGQIRNVPKVSPQSPLQDKVAKVFDDFGLVNDKNLIQTMLDENFEKTNFGIQSFAGYDVKLIDFCLQHHYWIEMNIPGSPATLRTFYINNGNYENIQQKSEEMDFETFKNEYYENLNVSDLGDLGERAEAQGMYTSEYIDDLINIAYDEYLEQKKDISAQNVNIKFAHRGMIYACNIYPFKTRYNSSKSVISRNSIDINYYKSINDDDYLVLQDKDDVKIRKTTQWCTKDLSLFMGYINGHDDDIKGFILILDDSLPYNHPDGAILVGLRNVSKNSIDYKLVKNLNAFDKDCMIPGPVANFFSVGSKRPKKTNVNNIANLIASYKQKYDRLNNLTHSNRFKSGQEAHQFLQSQFNNQIKESQMRLLRSYLRHLLS